MANPYFRGPHADPRPVPAEAPNAALLIDFDNVTMGMRSDLAKELQTLLGSDIIKGKVTVQRAYADWRRYPQYIVPLSEASIDLIFAPAYGSTKKNATDIRMAIDGIELVFIRPEIGTFILLTGDSDFSSLVLKLKEYGKYVIGIGIQESSSDILVQNCDEYYSYTSLAGLSKASDGKPAATDPWQCVREAVERMASRGDVMRSDRLKQVMMEMSPSFDERNLGFKKFSKFLVEASSKGLLQIERGQNGQYSVAAPGGGAADAGQRDGGRGKGARAAKGAAPSGDKGAERARVAAAGAGEGTKGAVRSGGKADEGTRGAVRSGGKADEGTKAAASSRGKVAEGAKVAAGSPRSKEVVGNPAHALALLRRALEEFREKGRHGTRDSTVKRKLLSMDPSFDESALGFSKFSKFLQFAADRREVDLVRLDGGGCEVRLREDASSLDAKALDAKALGLPSAADAMTSYLTNRYRGVGVKTAETLVKKFGPRLFAILQSDPDKVRALLPPGRADIVLLAWQEDYERRVRQAKGKAKAATPAVGRPRGDGAGRLRPNSRAANATAAPVSEEPRHARDSREPSASPQRSTPAQRELAVLTPPDEPSVPNAAAAHKKPSGIVGFLRQAARRTKSRGGED